MCVVGPSRSEDLPLKVSNWVLQLVALLLLLLLLPFAGKLGARNHVLRASAKRA